MNVLFVQAKLGPWRTLMLQTWKDMKVDPQSPVHRHGRTLSHAAAAELAHEVLVRVVKGMARSSSLRSQLRHWNELNQGTQYHSGFVAMCLGLDVLVTGGHLDLGSVGTMYTLGDSAQALRKLIQLSGAWSALSPVLCMPKTCSQWRQCMQSCMKVLAKKHMPS